MQKLLGLGIPLAGAVIIYLATNDTLQISGINPPPALSEARPLEAYAENVNTISYDDRGRRLYTLRAQRQLYFRDGSAQLENPYIQFHGSDQPDWHITSLSGKTLETPPEVSSEDHNLVELEGNVEILRLEQGRSRLEITTEKLLVDPVSETLTSNLDVAIVSDGLQLDSEGMVAELQSDELSLTRNVTGVLGNKVDR